MTMGELRKWLVEEVYSGGVLLQVVSLGVEFLHA